MVFAAKDSAMQVLVRQPSVGRVRLEVRGVQDGEVGREAGELRDRRADEHVAGEQRVPGWSVTTRTLMRCAGSAPA